MQSSMVQQPSGYFSQVCEYTGTYVSWDQGPRAASTEALCPITYNNGELFDHYITGQVSLALNLAKGSGSILELPLAAQWTRITESEASFEDKVAQWTWVMNAANNTSLITRKYGLRRDFQAKLKEWSNWSPQKLKDMINVTRTGLCDSSEISRQNLFIQGVHSQYQVPHGQKWSHRSHPEMETQWYTTLVDVARLHGLTQDEFDYYMTIDHEDSGQVDSASRVYYSFSCFTISDAESIGWNWSLTIEWARAKIAVMASSCNSAAEKAGHGNPGLEPIAFLAWTVTLLCQKITGLELKTQAPEEIRALLLDRYGLPMAPWGCHTFGSSICKLQDHGIAMKLGFTNDSDE